MDDKIYQLKLRCLLIRDRPGHAETNNYKVALLITSIYYHPPLVAEYRTQKLSKFLATLTMA